MQQIQETERFVTASEFARLLGASPSYVNQLLKDRRIPEAYRGENGRYRIPSRRCIIPSKYPKPGRKINDYFYRRDEVPEEWIEDPNSRPEPGVVLEGDESEPLEDRIKRTFGAAVQEAEDERFSAQQEEWEVDEEYFTSKVSPPVSLEAHSIAFTPISNSSGEEKRSKSGGEQMKSMKIDLDTWRSNQELRSIIDTEALKKIGIDLETLSQSETVHGLVILYK